MTKGTFFANVLNYFGESQISATEKVLVTLGTAIYLISPLDLMPGLPFDDLGVLGVAMAYMNWRMKKIANTSTKVNEVDVLPGEIVEESEDLKKNFFSDKNN